MISRVVVVRHLEGLLCAVGPMVSLLNLSSLHPWETRVLSNGNCELSSYKRMPERRFYQKIIRILHLDHYSMRGDSRSIIITLAHRDNYRGSSYLLTNAAKSYEGEDVIFTGK